jgi:chromosome segregation ATPase
MTEEGMISLNEFKTALEDVRSDIKKVVEVMNHRFDQVDARFAKVDERFDRMDGRIDRVNGRMDKTDSRLDRMEGSIQSLRQEVALLHEGQTEIKHELRRKADAEDLAKLEMRVTRLENKVA